MCRYRCVLAVFLATSLTAFEVPPASAASSPLGILTQASHAHLDDSTAFPGLSVFGGERLSTEVEGQLGVRAGHSMIALAAKTNVTLIRVEQGMHVDMDAGSLYFSVPADETVEVHAEDAMFRPETAQAAQARITILAPKVLQISAMHGNMNFSYRDEFRSLPEGQTYRIYLDAPSEPQVAAGSGGAKASITGKVAYFIVGVALGSVAVWKIRDRNSSGSAPESPWKP